MKLVSIIIPIYKDERFLEQCLVSIQNQTISDFQVFLCLRESQDNSENICKNFCEKDERFTLLKTKKKGISLARNMGLEKADSKFICFADSDDILEPNYLEVLIKNMEEDNSVDMVICDYKPERKYHKVKQKTEKKSFFDPITTINKIICSNPCGGFVWNKIFKKSLIGDLKFDETIHYAEDLLFCYYYLLNCKKVMYINNVFYHYIYHVDNTSTAKFNKGQLTAFDVMDKIIAHTKDQSIKENSYAWKGAIAIMILYYLKRDKVKDKEIYKQSLDILKASLPYMKKNKHIRGYIKNNAKFCYTVFKMIQ